MLAIKEFLKKTQKPAKIYVPHTPSRVNYRSLEQPDIAFNRILGNWINPDPGNRDGRNLLRKNLVGPTLTLWHRPHIRSFPGLWFWKSTEERYWLAKSSYLKSKGRSAPKKGAGKKAMRRMTDARKAAAKLAKAK